MSEEDEEGHALSLADMAKTIKKHGEALEALKDLPNILKQMSQTLSYQGEDDPLGVINLNEDGDELNQSLNPEDLLKTGSG